MDEKFEQDLQAIKNIDGREAQKQALIKLLTRIFVVPDEVESFNQAFDDQVTIELLFEVMSDQDQKGSVRSNAALLLEGGHELWVVTNKLIEIITSNYSKTQERLHACYALRGHWRHLNATDALIAIAQDDHELEVRITALSALYHHANNGVPEAAKRILKLCKDPEAKIRREIVLHCSEEGVHRLLKPHIEEFLVAETSNDDPNIRFHAINGLVANNFEGPDVIAAILKRIDDDREVTQAAFWGLRRLDGAFLIDGLLETVKRQVAKIKEHPKSIGLTGVYQHSHSACLREILSLERDFINILSGCGREHLEAALHEAITSKDWHRCRLLSTALQTQSEND